MRSFFRISSALLLVVWMVFIFFLSHQTAQDSSQTSGQVIEYLAEKFYPEFEEMTEVEKDQVISQLQFIVRKAAHMGMFAVLGFFAFLTFISYVDLRFLTRMACAVITGVLYAVSDELHQYFVPGRSCELRDFLIDTIGVFVAVLVCALFVNIIEPLRMKTAYEGVSKKALRELNFELYEKLDDVEYKNFKLERMLKEQEKTIEELETRLNSKQTVVVPQKTIFEEPFIEIEKEIVQNDETIESLSEETDFTEKVSQQLEQTDNLEQDSVKIETMPQEENVTEQPVETKDDEMKLDNEMEYAARVIGDCVVEVTKVCNKITMLSNSENQKELVNLALGRCEVFKSEIFKIIECEISFEAKKDLIEKERKDAFDYFDSIKAQMC